MSFLVNFFLRLTAFVMRVFCKAQQFAGVNIDEDLVCDSVGWLMAIQRPDGALTEVHRVSSTRMVVRKPTHSYQFPSKGPDKLKACVLP